MKDPEVREYSGLTFKKSELVSFPGVGASSAISSAKGFTITRRTGDGFVLVEYQGVEYEVSLGIIGVLQRKAAK